MNDGKILSNLKELRDALKNTQNSIFSYHVNNNKNDFANWIHEVIGDKELADKLRKTTSKLYTYKLVDQRVTHIINHPATETKPKVVETKPKIVETKPKVVGIKQSKDKDISNKFLKKVNKMLS